MGQETRAVFLTREELEVLQSAFEVLVNGEGTYMMIHLPEVVAIHKGLFDKFDAEMKAFWVAESARALEEKVNEPTSDPEKFIRCTWCAKEIPKDAAGGICEDCMPF